VVKNLVWLSNKIVGMDLAPFSEIVEKNVNYHITTTSYFLVRMIKPGL